MQKPNQIDSFRGEYRWLSNFATCLPLPDMDYPDILYSAVEYGYVASKTSDRGVRQSIALLPTPGAAKRFGQTLTVPGDWDVIKTYRMQHYLRLKFSQSLFKSRLIGTYPTLLIEGNTWHDNFWGICSCAKCGGKGLNRLGDLIMRVRLEMRPGCTGNHQTNK